MKNHQFIKLTVVSPVHVGCNEVYEPMSFFIDREKNTLTHFSIAEFLKFLDKKSIEQFKEICKEGSTESIIKLMQFIRRYASRFDFGNIDSFNIPVTDALISHYEQVLKVDNNINQFQIDRTAFSPLTNQVYIPGSSIKGAIRTAVLNYRSKQVKPKKGIKNFPLQKNVLLYSNPKDDPFRLLKVSDFYPIKKDVKRKICYAINKKKTINKRKDAKGPPQILETIEPTTEFIGTITLYEPVDKEIKSPLTIDEIKKAIKYFFYKEKEREDKELNNININPIKFNQDSLLLRIGRHSGAESVTVEGYRRIKIRQGKKGSRTSDHATTIWLAADSNKADFNLKPFGWTTFEFLSKEEGTKLSQLQEQVYNEIINNIKKKTPLSTPTNRPKKEDKKPLDPKAQMEKQFESFSKSLPNPASFPGEAAKILKQIESFEDDKLKIMCLKEIKKIFKNQIRKALRKNKKWAMSFNELFEKYSIS